MPMARKPVTTPTRAAAQPGLTRERIAEAALAQLSERGADGFSLRDVARTLGVFPTALYWYVRSRNDLLIEACALALSEVAPPRAKEHWQDWFRELFRRYRRVMRRHPNLAQVVGAQLVSNATLDVSLIEGILATLEDAGCPDDFIVDAYNAVVAAMCGFATLELAQLPREDEAHWADELQRRIRLIPALEHPTLARHLPALANRAFILRWCTGLERPLDSGFDAYVEAFLAGLDAQIRLRRPG
jgi:AcrR family transcriptional regulator